MKCSWPVVDVLAYLRISRLNKQTNQQNTHTYKHTHTHTWMSPIPAGPTNYVNQICYLVSRSWKRALLLAFVLFGGRMLNKPMQSMESLCTASAQSTCASSQFSTCFASQQGRYLGSQQGACLASQQYYTPYAQRHTNLRRGFRLTKNYSI